MQDRLWIVLIESKKTTFDIELAIPQTLAYMAVHPKAEQPLYGMITNGSSFLFVKTLGKQYGTSDLFATRSQHLNNLSGVLRVLKYLGKIVTES